jgi:GTP-binding protein
MMSADSGVFAIRGNGGNGCLSFRREKFIPIGGPNGGHGGNEGNVILISDENINDLSVYRFTPDAKAENGQHGMESEMDGRNGKHCFLKGPMGMVTLDSSGKILTQKYYSVSHGVLASGPLTRMKQN